MKEFSQIIVYFEKKDEAINGVLNFKVEDIATFYTITESNGFTELRIKGNRATYLVKISDLKNILERK